MLTKGTRISLLIVTLTTGTTFGKEPPAYTRAQAVDTVRRAYLQTYDGWSTDEVLLHDDRNRRFLDQCHRLLPALSAADANWTLLNLRKAGGLKAEVTRRRQDRHEDYRHAADIAARFMSNKYGLNTDRVLCDPARRKEFDEVATSAAPKVSTYRLRKAALGLRKARQLRPELVVRISDWGREILTFRPEQIIQNPKQVPAGPGIYIFRDRTGYLYVGESANLRGRITKHLDHSDRQALATYLFQQGIREHIVVELHAFDPDSKARLTPVRRAYESELIASRKPRFNVRP
ncbi:MAG: GIY-YIG nuclease family protein [Phycisphaerae bacterium]|nr:GIY-YIG nuclease family protein [Phycisphaerae bacterium]